MCGSSIDRRRGQLTSRRFNAGLVLDGVFPIMPVLTGVEDDIVLHGKKSRSSCNEPVADHSIRLWASEQTILSASCSVDEAEPPRRALCLSRQLRSSNRNKKTCIPDSRLRQTKHTSLFLWTRVAILDRHQIFLGEAGIAN